MLRNIKEHVTVECVSSGDCCALENILNSAVGSKKHYASQKNLEYLVEVEKATNFVVCEVAGLAWSLIHSGIYTRSIPMVQLISAIINEMEYSSDA